MRRSINDTAEIPVLPRARATAGALLAAFLLAACSSGDDDDDDGGSNNSFVPRSSSVATAAASAVSVAGDFLVFFADEATSGAGGTNFNDANGDTDRLDAIAVLVNLENETENVLGVAAEDAVVAGEYVYLVVRESSDTWDWNGDGDMDDRVLCRTRGASGSPASQNVAFVATLDPDTVTPALEAAGKLFFVSEPSMSPSGGESTLRVIDPAAAPTASSIVPFTDAMNSADPGLLMVDEGLVFLSLDEALEGRDLNDDGDSDSDLVLALLDATDASGAIQNVGLAIDEDGDVPLRARAQGEGNWLVAFLVSESDQDNFPTGLNDPVANVFPASWFPENCPSYADTDTDDDVLHFLRFAAWFADPMGSAPVNTGLAGKNRVVVVPGAVATIADEEEDGECDLNFDGDLDDDIARWTLTSMPLAPFGRSDGLVALEDVAGGTYGLTDLDNRLIALVDEEDDSRQHDDREEEDHLVAWLDPADGGAASWEFDHSPQPGIQSIGAAWLAERAERDRLLVGFQESVFGVSINTGGDQDTEDVTPVFARFDPGDPLDLDFPGPAVAVSAANPGIEISDGVAFYRVDEFADNRDWNDDGEPGFVLFRTDVNSLLNNFFIGSLNTLPGPATLVGSDLGAGFLADETIEDVDYNGDGDRGDTVLRWFLTQ